MTSEYKLQARANWIPLIYTKEVEIRETLKTASSPQAFLDIYLTFDTNVQLSTRSSDKRDNVWSVEHL